MKLSRQILPALLLCLALSVVLSSCTSGGKFASSFGKRKYNKGYYFDFASTENNRVARSLDLPGKASHKLQQTLPPIQVALPSSAIHYKQQVEKPIITKVSRKALLDIIVGSKLSRAVVPPISYPICINGEPGKHASDGGNHDNVWFFRVISVILILLTWLFVALIFFASRLIVGLLYFSCAFGADASAVICAIVALVRGKGDGYINLIPALVLVGSVVLLILMIAFVSRLL